MLKVTIIVVYLLDSCVVQKVFQNSLLICKPNVTDSFHHLCSEVVSRSFIVCLKTD